MYLSTLHFHQITTYIHTIIILLHQILQIVVEKCAPNVPGQEFTPLPYDTITLVSSSWHNHNPSQTQFGSVPIWPMARNMVHHPLFPSVNLPVVETFQVCRVCSLVRSSSSPVNGVDGLMVTHSASPYNQGILCSYWVVWSRSCMTLATQDSFTSTFPVIESLVAWCHPAVQDLILNVPSR